MSRADAASENMTAGRMNCAQSVLTAYCQELGLDLGLALKVATGFGGGMRRTGKTCGAVTGAYMVLGLKQNVTPENANQIKTRVYEIVKVFNRKFIEKNRSVTCNDLLGCDISTPEGQTYAREKGLFKTICPRLVRDSVEILDSMDKG